METKKICQSAQLLGQENAVRSFEQATEAGLDANLAAHTSVSSACQKIAKARGHLRIQLNAIAEMHSETEQADHGIRPLPAEIRVRMALRLGLATLKRNGSKALSPKALLSGEFDFLSERLEEKKLTLARLEERILATRPQCAGEADKLLKFVSHLMASRRNLPQQELARLLEDCAAAKTKSGDLGASNINDIQKKLS